MRKLTCLYAILGYALSVTNAKLRQNRERLLKEEFSYTLGGNMTLTDKEETVNNCLMKLKFKELNYAFDNPNYFNFTHHFFTYKNYIEESKVYQIIRGMPKGAVLHVHDMGILGPDYLMNITYKDNLYICAKNIMNKEVTFKFSNKTPSDNCSSQWQLLKEKRKAEGEDFDINLRKHFTLVVNDPDTAYPTIKESWTAFIKYFGTVQPLLTYRPIWEQYFYDALEAFRNQNIMYVEVRSILPNLYELDGTEYDALITAKAYRKVIKKFMNDHPDFIGAKLIYAPPRNVERQTVKTYIEVAGRIKQDMPDIFAGFDLVGEEDTGAPLLYFLPELGRAAKDFNYFFHAGETDWYGSLTDENLVDAILLGAKRIGHAYALPKHPLLKKFVIEKDIGLEVNVISNAVLSLVKDIRNHPLSTFFADNLPVVLSSDDPGVWESDPISYDFYVAFVGVASKHSDLRLLKTLALNSLKYSALDTKTKKEAIAKFNHKWKEFIDNFKCTNDATRNVDYSVPRH